LRDRARPGACVRGLRVVALAMPEIEGAQVDHLRVGLELAGACHRVSEQRVRRREAWIPVVHRRGRDAEHATWGPRGFGVLVEQVTRLVLEQLPRRYRRYLNVDSIGALLEGVNRHLLFVIAGWALAGHDAVLPPMPRTRHELLVQPSLGERA